MASENVAAQDNGAALVPVALEEQLDRLKSQPIIDTIDARTLALIKAQVAPGCSEAQVGHFLELTAHYGLDPFAREAWCAISKTGKLLIMVGRDGVRMTSRSSSEELRTRAVEAAHWALDGSLCRFDEDRGQYDPIDSNEHGNVPREEEDVVRDMVAAAEPFIRELVVAEVVAWIEEQRIKRVFWNPVRTEYDAALDALSVFLDSLHAEPGTDRSER
jgi:hypothetical protein